MPAISNICSAICAWKNESLHDDSVPFWLGRSKLSLQHDLQTPCRVLPPKNFSFHQPNPSLSFGLSLSDSSPCVVEVGMDYVILLIWLWVPLVLRVLCWGLSALNSACNNPGLTGGNLLCGKNSCPLNSSASSNLSRGISPWWVSWTASSWGAGTTSDGHSNLSSWNTFQLDAGTCSQVLWDSAAVTVPG